MRVRAYSTIFEAQLVSFCVEAVVRRAYQSVQGDRHADKVDNLEIDVRERKRGGRGAVYAEDLGDDGRDGDERLEHHELMDRGGVSGRLERARRGAPA